MRSRLTVVVLVLLVGYYLFVVGDRAVALVRDDRLAFRGLGAGLVLLGLLGVALVAAELRFGRRTQLLAREAGEVDGDFDGAKAAVEAAPEDWRAWYRLAVAYDTGRDPKRGRAAMRRAIELRGSD